jgi:hypothetical protein
MDAELKEVRTAIRTLYTPLDRRVTNVETRVKKLENA